VHSSTDLPHLLPSQLVPNTLLLLHGDTYKAEKKERFAVLCGADVVQGRCYDMS